MKKKKIITLLIALGILCFALIRIFSGSKSKMSLETFAKNLNTYNLEGKMQIFNNEDKREFMVEVVYEREKNYYKISLMDLDINQTQVILKNDEGVFVLNPNLNQVYKFDSQSVDFNKPYVYDYLINLSKDDKITKTNNGYLIKGKANYEGYSSFVNKEVKLDKDYHLKYVNIYDKEDDLALSFEVKKLSINSKLNDDEFDVNSILNNYQNYSTTSVKVSEEELPFLPTSYEVDASLKESSTYEYNNSTYYILTYEGSGSFTLVQHIITKSEELEVSDVDGKVVSLLNGVGYYSNNKLSYVYNNVAYDLYSEMLSLNEMINLANNVEVSFAK